MSACSDAHGTGARAVLSLSTTLKNNTNNSELAKPAFLLRPASLPSVLEGLKAGMNNDRKS